MESELEKILTGNYKAEMILYLKQHSEAFEEAILLALSDKKPYSWRAAWILWSSMDYNDKRIQTYVQKIIEILPSKTDNIKRELMMILQRMEIDEDLEGKLFDICLNIWEQTDKQASVRHNAFRLIVKIAKKHPELLKEIIFLTESQYLESLSNGVKRAVLKLLANIQTDHSPVLLKKLKVS